MAAILIAMLSGLLMPPYYGSGITRANPLSIIPAGASWFCLLLYIMFRIDEDADAHRSLLGLTLLHVGAFFAAIAVPAQVLVCRMDAGFPQPRWRTELLGPSVIGVPALLLATLGRALIRLRKAKTSKTPTDPH